MNLRPGPDRRLPHVVSRAPFTVSRYVRWGESDPAGIIYTGSYLDFMVEAAEDFFVDLTGRHWRDMQTLDGGGTPMVHASMDFLRPVQAGGVMEIVVYLGEIGRSSFDLHFLARDEAGAPCFTGKLTGVHIAHTGPGEITAQPLPTPLRAAMEAYRAANPLPELPKPRR